MDVTLMFTRLKTWGIKGGLSLLDQVIFSGANFVLSIFLARRLIPTHFGTFSVIFSIYLFAYQTHNAIIVEPMSVLGPSNMHYRLADYFREQIKLHFVFSIICGLVIMSIGLFILEVNQVLGQGIIIMGILLPCILLPLLMRRGFYLFQKPHFSLLGSVAYALCLFGGLWITYVTNYLSVNLAFSVIGLASLMSGIVLFKQIPPKQSFSISFLDTWSSNWKYGRWLVYSSFFIALAAQIQIFVVSSMLGLADAGAFRALQNFIQPMILFLAAISAFMLPSLSYDFGRGHITSIKNKGRSILVLFLFVSICFELILLLFGSTLESILYGGKFSSYTYLIPAWGLVPIAGVLTYVYYFLLQSIQRPGAVLAGAIIWSAASSISSVVLSTKWGIAGATISVITGYLLSGIAFAFLYQFYISQTESKRTPR